MASNDKLKTETFFMISLFLPSSAELIIVCSICKPNSLMARTQVTSHSNTALVSLFYTNIKTFETVVFLDRYLSLVMFWLSLSFFYYIIIMKLYMILTVCHWLVGLSLPCWTSVPVLCPSTLRARFIRQWRMLGYVSSPSLTAHLYGMYNYISSREPFKMARITLCINLVKFNCLY